MLIDSTKLIERLRNDRYSLVEHPGDAHAQAWNSASQHVELVIVPALQAEQRVLDGLTELRRQAEWLASDGLAEMQEAML
jgi:hypothetical protein